MESLEEKLFNAVRAGNLSRVNEYIAQHVDVNTQTFWGVTPLHMAASFGWTHIAEVLLNAGAKVNKATRSKYTATHFAAKNNQVMMLHLLNCHQGHLEATTSIGETPLALAIQAGHEHVVDYLLRQNVDANEATEFGDTPLHWAVTCQHYGIVEQLLEYGVDINARDTSNSTPLMIAAQLNDLYLLNKLIVAGADPYLEDVSYYRIIEIATQFAHHDALEFLVQHDIPLQRDDTKTHPIYVAACEGHLATVQFLQAHQLSINFVLENGNTVLHGAAQSGNAELGLYCLKQNLNINATNNQGETPLSIAVSLSHRSFVHLLLQRSVDLDWKNNCRQNLLHLACKNNDPVIPFLLLPYFIRSKINATDKYGKTALHYAADNGQERLVSILINQKSDFDKQDGNLDTPLHIAIKKGKSDVIHHLLEAGARTDLKNLQGRTALALVDRTINALTKSYKITQRKSTQQYLEKYQKIRLDIIKHQTHPKRYLSDPAWMHGNYPTNIRHAFKRQMVQEYEASQGKPPRKKPRKNVM